MADDVDFWEVLDEAEQTVHAWPPWQQRYEADVFYRGQGAGGGAQVMSSRRPALRPAPCPLRSV